MPPGSAVVLVAAPTAGSTRRTTALLASPTQTEPPPAAMPVTDPPGITVPCRRIVRESMRLTVASSRLATHTDPAASTGVVGRTPTCTLAMTLSLPGSITATALAAIRTGGGAPRRRGTSGGGTDVEHRVLAQHRVVKLAHRRARFDAELVDEPLPALAVD